MGYVANAPVAAVISLFLFQFELGKTAHPRHWHFTAATGQLLNACFFIFTGQVANALVAAVISLFVLSFRNRAK